jgi:hypothetical protein
MRHPAIETVFGVISGDHSRERRLVDENLNRQLWRGHFVYHMGAGGTLWWLRNCLDRLRSTSCEGHLYKSQIFHGCARAKKVCPQGQKYAAGCNVLWAVCVQSYGKFLCVKCSYRAMPGTKQDWAVQVVLVGCEHALATHHQGCSGRNHTPLSRCAKFDKILMRRLLTRTEQLWKQNRRITGLGTRRALELVPGEVLLHTPPVTVTQLQDALYDQKLKRKGTRMPSTNHVHSAHKP